MLFVLATNTWNAYNDWGGRSLYTGGHQVSFQRPFGRGMLVRPETDRDDRKARPRRPGEQPDIDGDVYQRYRHEHGYPGYMGSAGWYTYDRRFAEWAERAGIELDYAVSSDLEGVEGLTDGYRLVVGAGHDEYWSGPQRDAVERFVENGGNYASFSGNTMFWQVRLVDDGAAMVCHKYSAHLDDPIASRRPGAMTGMWCDPLIGRPESRFLGASSMYGLYSRFGQATPRGVGGFVIYRDDHWMLDGTDLRYGDVLGADDGVVGYETVGTRARVRRDEPAGHGRRPAAPPTRPTSRSSVSHRPAISRWVSIPPRSPPSTTKVTSSSSPSGRSEAVRTRWRRRATAMP